VGSIARLCANFDISELRLVNPKCNIDNELAIKMSMKGKQFLYTAKQYSSLHEAVADCKKIVTTCGRKDHNYEIPLVSPNDALKWLLNSQQPQVAIVFGREDRGLDNQELGLSNKVISIDTGSKYQSLNLSHAVSIVLYELKRVREKSSNKTIILTGKNLANQSEINDFIDDARKLLLEIGFLHEHTSQARMRKIRRMLNKSELNENDIAILRGIIKQLKWAINQKKE
tara:strand:+ start:2803 stop:3486 length:684 start_codon:yes stop_codon:yes gene_type:complete